MKVHVGLVKAEFRTTRALEPHMMGKPFEVPNDKWADLLEKQSKGKIRRYPGTVESPPRRRVRRKKED